MFFVAAGGSAAAAAAALRSAPRPLPTLPLDGSTPWRDEADDHAKREEEHKAKLTKKAENKAAKAKAKAKAAGGGGGGVGGSGSKASGGAGVGGSKAGPGQGVDVAGATQGVAGLSLSIGFAASSRSSAPNSSASPATPWTPSPALRARASWLPPSLTVAVMGHVDAGKSTLVGRLLFETGAVSDKAARAALRGAKEAGKASFGWAWLLDERSAERARGVTSETARVTVQISPEMAQRGARTSTGSSSSSSSSRPASSASSATSLTLVDTPGHAELVSTALDGAAGADALLLVIDGASGPEAALGEGGPARALAAIARAVGAREVVVAVTKLDAVRGADGKGGSDAGSASVEAKGRFEALAAECVARLKALGFAPSRIAVVPVVGPTGENVVARGPGKSLDRPAKGSGGAGSDASAPAVGSPSALGWYDGPSVLHALCAAAGRSAASRAEALELQPRATLLDAADLAATGGASPGAASADAASSASVRVRVLSGGLEPGMRLLVQPLGVHVQVMHVKPRSDARSATGKSTSTATPSGTGGRGPPSEAALAVALPGEEADASLRLLPPAKAAALAAGDVLCADPSVDPSPALPATKLAAKILVLDPAGPVVPGTPVVAHVGGVSRPGRVMALAAVEPGSRKPRFLRKGDRGLVHVALEAPLCVESRPSRGKGRENAAPPALSRIVLRGAGKTVGAGVIEDTLELASTTVAER